ncbi:unnamed protein product [marine sediment metagenome]|uniref:Uncharacterized protein n=1 Tax=marine sediment metagenome TaxID=412755 RepID=X0SEB7_9ZZZZ
MVNLCERGNPVIWTVKRIVLFSLIVSTVGCSGGLRELETTTVALQNSQNAANAKIQKLSQEVATEKQALRKDVTGRIERLSVRLEKLSEEIATLQEIHAQETQELRNHITLISDQLIRMERKGFQPTSRQSAGIAAFRPDVYETSASYKTARQDYEAGKYDQAIGEFMEILAIAPRSVLADNAQYWIGECYYGLANYLQALNEFEKVFAYKTSEKKPDAQLKIGLCYLKMDNRERAIRELEKVLANYPATEASEKVKTLLNNVKKK